MKTVFLNLLACTAILLPLAQANAAGPASKTFGGFAPGTKATLTVTKVESMKLQNFVSTKCPIPAGVAKFKKGQQVKFTVGLKGEWTGPNINLPFVKDNGPSNNYMKHRSTNFNDDEADVFKDTLNHPVGADFFLYKETHGGLGTIPVVYTVKYTFSK